jgi:hypothetical protein
MLGPKTHADESRWYSSENRKPSQQTQRQRQGELCRAGEHPANDTFLDQDLQPLGRVGWPLSPALNTLQVGGR